MSKNNNTFNHKISLYLRTERTMLDIFVRDKLRQCFFISLAFIALITSLIMFDIALFFTLKTYTSSANTGFILAGGHLLLCFIFFLAAQRKKHRREIEALRDIRDFAKEQVNEDLKTVTDEVVHMGKSVQRVTHDISSIFSSEAFGLAGLIPLLHSLLKSKK